MAALRIVHVSTDDISGGAARCAYCLHRSLRALGHDSSMLVARRRSDDPTVALVAAPNGLHSRLRRRMRRWRMEADRAPYRETRPVSAERFSDDRSWLEVDGLSPPGSWDVVNLHWVAGFVDYGRYFDGLPDRVPVVWTLHDMNVFTGGCHYDQGCGRFAARCGACPQLGSDREEDLSRKVWERKSRLFGGLDAKRLRFVTPSEWLAKRVEESSLVGTRFPVSVIPNGVDTDEFAPRDARGLRAALGIPQEARVILFVAQSVTDKRKGFDVLIEGLRLLSGRADLVLLSLGSGSPKLEIPIRHLHLGNVQQDRLLSMVYSAADVFVVPSLQENLPTTALESLACGTPVVGFDTGGIPEVVRAGVTGHLASPGDVRGLASGIASLLCDGVERTRYAHLCRQVAVQEYGSALQAHRYEELYRRLLGPGPGVRSATHAPSSRAPAHSASGPTVT